MKTIVQAAKSRRSRARLLAAIAVLAAGEARGHETFQLSYTEFFADSSSGLVLNQATMPESFAGAGSLVTDTIVTNSGTFGPNSLSLAVTGSAGGLLSEGQGSTTNTSILFSYTNAIAEQFSEEAGVLGSIDVSYSLTGTGSNVYSFGSQVGSLDESASTIVGALSVDVLQTDPPTPLFNNIGPAAGTFSVPILAGRTAGFFAVVDVKPTMTQFGEAFVSAGLTLSFSVNLTGIDFVWDGKEGFAFGDAGNWGDNIAPGPRNTVSLTDTQPKRIEFEGGGFVTNARLIVEGDSETEIDLNGGVWRIDPGATAPAEDGQLRMAGANLEIRDGTLEVFGRVVMLNDGASSGLLDLREGGKLLARGADFVTGRGPGGQGAFLQINGPGSLLEARAIVLGEQSGRFTGLISGGGQMVAGQALIVGGDAPATLVFGGLADPEDAPNSGSRLTVGEGGTLGVGVNAEGSLSFTGGAAAVLTEVAVTIGAGEAKGSFVVGEGAIVAGGRFSLGANGLLQVDAGHAGVERLNAEGGAVDVRAGGRILAGESVALFGGASLKVDGGGLVRAPTLFTASSQIEITGNSRLEVTGLEGLDSYLNDGTQTARMLGGTLRIEAGSVFETPVLNIQAGTVLGSGLIEGTVVNAGGSIRPGESPGVLTIEGDYIQTGGELVLEIGGVLAGVDHDQLVVTGDFSLSGDAGIELSFIDGFAPQAGQVFVLLDVGEFFFDTAMIRVSGLADGWEFIPEFDEVGGVFSITSLNNGVFVIPEPASFAALVGGAVLLFGAGRRRGRTRGLNRA